MTAKQAVLEMIKGLPDDVSLADIMAELYFRHKVDRGLRELDKGKGVPHSKVRKHLRAWLH